MCFFGPQRSDEILLANSDVMDDDNDMEMEYNDALLRTILAAGNSATSKRSVSKKYVTTIYYIKRRGYATTH